MKHRLLFSLLFGGMAIGASAQTIQSDLTSKLTNADFTQGSPVASTIYTYDYNMTDDGAGAGGTSLFGMQAVPGWTASNPTDNIKVMQSASDPDRGDGTNAKASGLFAYEDDSNEQGATIGLGGAFYAPYINDGITTTTNALGIVSVWGANPTYSQEITLSAGAYMLEVTLQNVAGTANIDNLIGFVDGNGTEYLSTYESYDVNVWTTDQIRFHLEEATTGKIQLGFICSSGSGSAPHLFIDNVKLYQIDENEMIQEEIDAAKEELSKLVEIGKAYGVDTSASQAVLNNPNATLEQVMAAIANQEEINESGVTDLSPYFINNPHFNSDDAITGGICTYDHDMETNSVNFYGSQPLSGWVTYRQSNNTYISSSDDPEDGRASGVYEIGSGAFLGGTAYIVPTTMSDGSTSGKVLGMVTCWSKKIQYTQNTTLPAGTYTLSMSYFNTGGTTAINKNLIGFITDDGTEYLAQSLTFPIGTWTTDKVEFTLTEETSGYFSLGYEAVNTGSGNMPHFFTDGISLVYVGTDIDPSMMALVSAVNTGNTLAEEYFQLSLKEQLESAIERGQELIDAESKDSEANIAAAQAITSMTSEINKSIDAYKRLKEFYEGEFSETYDEYEQTSLKSQLETMNDEIFVQVEDEPTWTVEEIDACIASLPGIIRAYVQELFDKAVETGTSDGDINISILYSDLLGATYSDAALSGGSVVDKQWNYGDAGNFKTQYGTMEVWNQSPFTVSQTMTGMPAGTYTLKTRAFYRTADQITNYADYNANPVDYAYVFAGNLKTPLSNVALIASSEEGEFSASQSEVEEGSGIFVPNSQLAAHNVFENIFKNYDETTLKSVQTVLTSD